MAAALTYDPCIIQDLLHIPSSDALWEHQRLLLSEELSITDAAAALAELPALLDKVARDVELAKVRDDERGVRVIDVYKAAHGRAAADPFV